MELPPHPPTNPPSERIKYKAEIPISVIRAAQAKTRRYKLERKIFQQLLDLKQMQIRIGQANEQVFAKRLIDGFRKDAVTVGLRPYDGSYSFQQLEVYLYSQLRLVQGGRTLLPLVDSATDREDVTNGLYGDVETESTNGGSRTMPVDKCTHTTQRCLTPCMLTRHCRRPATLAFHALHSFRTTNITDPSLNNNSNNPIIRERLNRRRKMDESFCPN
uniref:Uncharacterized protein n=1 Tax=Daphnia galeata TaxID=27404 RepID=A0A8J2S0I3_9CRUS|nr:unnamed protein product [Daphnia galeata]